MNTEYNVKNAGKSRGVLNQPFVCDCAQTANFSLKILALCRTSTGKSGWIRNRLMP